MFTPLACTIVDWATFIATCDKFGIPAPSRALDAVGLDLKSPASFLAAIGGSGPVENLRKAYVRKHTDLVHLIFMVESEDRVVEALGLTRLTLTNYGEITLLSGSLTQYMDTVIAHSIKHDPLLKFCNALFVYLDRGGFRECFYDYQREAVGETFTINHR
jgi:hypothetical protein